MKNKANIFGAGMGILTIAVVYGVLANSALNEKFAKSVAVNNGVLGVNNMTNSPVITNNPYEIEATDIVISNHSEATQTNRASLKVVIKNNTDTTLELSPGLHIHLIDTDGTFYSYTAEFLTENVTIGGSVLSGQSMDLALDFVIPKNSIPAKLELAVDAQNPYRISL
jgi:hypothetical protein